METYHVDFVFFVSCETVVSIRVCHIYFDKLTYLLTYSVAKTAILEMLINNAAIKIGQDTLYKHSQHNTFYAKTMLLDFRMMSADIQGK